MPKLTKSAKQDLILTHLRATGTCHTLKDLEKTLPSIASINGIQVKEYIQALTDEGKLRVEKIGSGNWYWSFGSDEKHERERQLARVTMEVEKARKSYTDAEAALAAETMRREEEADDEDERESLMTKKAQLQVAIDRVRTTEAQLSGPPNSPSSKGVKQVQEELAGFQHQALQWTDNIYTLEEYLRKLTGGDRQIIESVLRECYGDEYVDGEGLGELG
ncbi:Meiotic nuclear division protein 1 [Penicillium coprophilum]|uniref:Meiotic nuclear division protein 1 n=1 Tax=Penicillium coprophilum TaxID=36646 RepID=UPI00239C611F|nr:Meiotic nuclear division protein 1 [Penicillium coprophilum]KAJ5163236.1 Meiotic nuclear division protein 1 [Penicillium coprophilum]